MKTSLSGKMEKNVFLHDFQWASFWDFFSPFFVVFQKRDVFISAINSTSPLKKNCDFDYTQCRQPYFKFWSHEGNIGYLESNFNGLKWDVSKNVSKVWTSRDVFVFTGTSFKQLSLPSFRDPLTKSKISWVRLRYRLCITSCWAFVSWVWCRSAGVPPGI